MCTQLRRASSERQRGKYEHGVLVDPRRYGRKRRRGPDRSFHSRATIYYCSTQILLRTESIQTQLLNPGSSLSLLIPQGASQLHHLSLFLSVCVHCDLNGKRRTYGATVTSKRHSGDDKLKLVVFLADCFNLDKEEREKCSSSLYAHYVDWASITKLSLCLNPLYDEQTPTHKALRQVNIRERNSKIDFLAEKV